ncbi:MAG: type II toxin-antitoxin system prevent-host-death family antitoxin [Candidatus Hatepunaea meridiana]|nr:type II toxin-antitoxin system prevent-host-death family antitoxin [Candidatus Hatepunaea meridiana]
MTRMTTSETRRAFADVVNRVSYGGERIIIHRREKDLVAIVPIEDLELIERIEDEIDIKEVKKILAANEPTYTLEEVERELGHK